MRPTQIYAAVQKQARERGRAADEPLTLYGMERFLARLSSTTFAEDFVLKGGVLLSAYHPRTTTPRSSFPRRRSRREAWQLPGGRGHGR
jgi:hypothetical protein